jgi:L-lysine 2,3-aminomutase
MAHIVTLNTPSREDWLSQLADVITSPDELLRLLDLDQHQELLAGREAKRLFALRVPRAFVARMEKGNPDDPLLKQTLTSQDEFVTAPGTAPIRWKSRTAWCRVYCTNISTALLLVKGGCAVNCRYCFRRLSRTPKIRAINATGRSRWIIAPIQSWMRLFFRWRSADGKRS